MQACPILTHPNLPEYPSSNLSALAFLMGGGSPSEYIKDPWGTFTPAGDLAPSNYTDFIAHPTYNMMVTTITFTKTSRKAGTVEGTHDASYPKGFKPADPSNSKCTCLGSSYTYDSTTKLYKITTTYRIITWPADPFKNEFK